MLKSNWERYQEHIAIDQTTAIKLLAPYSNNKILTLKPLSNGCANTNYQVIFTDNTSVVLRIYLREHASLAREAGIYKLVNNLLPIPEILYADDSCSNYHHPYVISQYMEGILLRDLIFSNDEPAITDTAREAGHHLSILRALKLPVGGFFQDDLQIRPFTPEEEYEPYLIQLLQDNAVATNLGNRLQQDLQQLISQCCHLLPEINDANLTHGDYDPANILVNDTHGCWKITAILDWEFAFSGTYLLDIGMMLRYAHKLPRYFEKNFIDGIEESGPSLPSDWKKQATLMDLICLLQLLQQNPPSLRPHLNRDVIQLINHKVKNFTRI